jgi:hypothetical protein
MSIVQIQITIYMEIEYALQWDSQSLDIHPYLIVTMDWRLFGELIHKTIIEI